MEVYISVSSSAQCRKIQEIVFSAGGDWAQSGREIKYLDHRGYFLVNITEGRMRLQKGDTHFAHSFNTGLQILFKAIRERVYNGTH